METHRDTFETGTAAASYVTGIYEARYDASVLVFEEVEEPNETRYEFLLLFVNEHLSIFIFPNRKHCIFFVPCAS